MAGETDATTTTTETEAKALPENASIAEAAALMANLEGDDDVQPPVGEPAPSEAVEAEPAEGEGAEPGEGEGEAETEAGEDAPEFWSAEDKEFWKTVPVELRPVLKKYEQQRIEFANQKADEAARASRAAEEKAKAATDKVTEAATWWQQNGERFNKTFADKWAGVDWATLANDNPAEWARLRQQRDSEAEVLAEANRRGQADMEAARQRHDERIRDLKREAHETVARTMPDIFGTPEKAKKTYDAIGAYLVSKGMPADRVNLIHEAPVIEMAAKAWLYDQAKKQVSTVAAKPAATNASASATPTRVQPGPARAGNQGSERVRQARERINSGRSVSAQDAASLISSLGL